MLKERFLSNHRNFGGHNEEAYKGEIKIWRSGKASLYSSTVKVIGSKLRKWGTKSRLWCYWNPWGRQR